MLVKGLRCGPFEEPVHHVAYFFLPSPPIQGISLSTLHLTFAGHFVRQRKNKRAHAGHFWQTHTNRTSTFSWTHTCILENLLRGEQEKEIEGRRGEEERMKDEDRAQMHGRLRGREGKTENWRERETLLPLATALVSLSCRPCLDLRLCLPAGPGVHVCS